MFPPACLSYFEGLRAKGVRAGGLDQLVQLASFPCAQAACSASPPGAKCHLVSVTFFNALCEAATPAPQHLPALPPLHFSLRVYCHLTDLNIFKNYLP